MLPACERRRGLRSQATVLQVDFNSTIPAMLGLSLKVGVNMNE